MGQIDRRLVVGLGVAIFAISWAAVLFRLAPGLDPRTAAGWRLVIAAGLLGLWVWRGLGVAGGERARLDAAARPARYGWLVVAAGVAYGVHFGTWVASLGMVPVALSVTAVTTTPLLLALVGLVTGHDRPSRRVLMSLGVGFGGLILMSGSSEASGEDWTVEGVLLALVGAAAMGVYLWLARTAMLRNTMETLRFSCLAAGIGGVLLLGSAVVSGVGLGFASVDEFLVVVGAAAVPQLVGHTLLTWAVGRTSPTKVALATLGEPVLAGLLAFMVLGEALGGLAIVGGVVTLVAVGWAMMPSDVSAGTGKAAARR